MHQIKYSNGFIQYKCLVSDNDFINDIKPSIAKMVEVSQNKTTEANDIKIRLKEQYGYPDMYFVESSPLGIAFKTGVLVLPKDQGGCQAVIIKKIM